MGVELNVMLVRAMQDQGWERRGGSDGRVRWRDEGCVYGLEACLGPWQLTCSESFFAT